ncbi:MAG: hypothetical protein PHS64_02205 [Candidatus Omnitrophica bacterium]|nr:hypothetical protein [Candidatus Omnitrophota bacterium]
MENTLSYPILNHSWTKMVETGTAEAFHVGVWTRNTLKDALGSILYGEDGNVYAHISLIGNKGHFPPWTVKEILNDMKKFILRKGAYKILEGDITVEGTSDSFTLDLDDKDIPVLFILDLWRRK